MGIDYGNRRIGIALSESGVLATPHSVISNGGNLDQAAEKIAAIARDVGADLIVVGVPERDRGEVPAKFERFAGLLRDRTNRPVEMWNEAYTTTEALSRRHSRGGGRRTRQPIDHEAAAIMLQSYIDEKEPGP